MPEDEQGKTAADRGGDGDVRTLARLRAKLRWLVEGSGEAIFFATAEGVLTHVNPRAVELLGYGSADDLVGQAAEVLYHDPTVRALLRRLLMAEGNIEPIQLTFRRADGTPLRTHGRASATRDSDGEVVELMGAFVDDSHRTELDAQIEYQADLLRAIREILSLDDGTSEEGVWHHCLDAAMTLSESTIGVAGVVDGAGAFVPRAVMPDALLDAFAGGVPERIVPRGLLRWLIEKRYPLIANEPALHPMFEAPPEQHPELHCLIGVPLEDGGEVRGLIVLGNKAGCYGADDRAAVEVLAPAIVHALRKARHRPS